MDLPTGTVTFLFTDIEGSTELWEQDEASARTVLLRHDQIIEALVDDNEGMLVRPRGEGDSRFAVFEQAPGAVVAAASIQRAFGIETWPTPEPRGRTSVHCWHSQKSLIAELNAPVFSTKISEVKGTWPLEPIATQLIGSRQYRMTE